MSGTDARALVKDGIWQVPVEQRPAGWQDLGCREPDCESAPTEEQVAGVVSDVAAQMAESVVAPARKSMKDYQRDWCRERVARRKRFAEFAEACEVSGKEFGDAKLIPYGKLLIAGMFSARQAALADLCGLSKQNVVLASQRLVQAGIWRATPHDGYLVHMGDEVESMPDMGFWLNAMVAAGQCYGRVQENGSCLYCSKPFSSQGG